MKRKTYGTYKIAQICDVAALTVGRWIANGHLPAFTTPGGHHRVWEADLYSFLKSHNIPVPYNIQSIRTASILIVDDDNDVRRTLKRMLGKNFPEWNVFEAADGYEAGFKIASIKPSLIILDICLPHVDGFKICRMIRSDENLKEMKIVAITGQDAESCKMKALAAGADAFFAKPFSSKVLLQEIRKLNR